MSDIKLLSNPPIQEALVHFEFSLPQVKDVDQLLWFTKQLTEDYPIIKEKISFELKFKPNSVENSQHSSQKKVVGFMLTSNDKRKVVQISTNSYTFSIIRPYKNWEELLDETMKGWNLFISKAEDLKLLKLGIRFINNITFEINDLDSLGDFIKLTPVIPEEIPNMLENLFMQITLSDENGIKTNITQTTQSITGNVVNYIFDIELFKGIHLSGYDSRIIDTLLIMRKLKNKIFFNSLSEKVLSKYI